MDNQKEQKGLFDFIPSKLIQIKAPPVSKKKRLQKKRKTVATFLHLGAGVQSSTIVEMMIEGDLEPVDAVLFADTGEEPSWVYQQVEYLKGRLESIGIPLHIVRKPNSEGLIKDLSSASRFASMPLFTYTPQTGSVAILKRQCTYEYKVNPCNDFTLDWLLENGYAKRNKAGARRVDYSIKTDNIFGISVDESFRTQTEAYHGVGWKAALYPLIEKNMGRSDCIQYLKDKGLRIPRKSSCIVCPYHNDEYWLDLKLNAPEEFEIACQFDDWLRSPDCKVGQYAGINDELYLHRSCKPLREIDFAARIEASKTGQMDMFAAELIDGKTCASDGGFSCMS